MLFTVGGGGCGPGECLHLEKLERHDFSKDDDISKTSSTLRVKISHLLWNKRKKRVKFIESSNFLQLNSEKICTADNILDG